MEEPGCGQPAPDGGQERREEQKNQSNANEAPAHGWHIKEYEKATHIVQALFVSGLNVSAAEILTFEEQRLAGGPRESISKAIAEIETGGVTSFAEVGEALSGKKGLLLRDRFDCDSRATEKRVALADAAIASLSFHDDRDFNKIRSGDAQRAGFADGFGVKRRIGFGEQDGKNSGGVQNQLGRPRLS
jgi:hypothetical protein